MTGMLGGKKKNHVTSEPHASTAGVAPEMSTAHLQRMDLKIGDVAPSHGNSQVIWMINQGILVDSCGSMWILVPSLSHLCQTHLTCFGQKLGKTGWLILKMTQIRALAGIEILTH